MNHIYLAAPFFSETQIKRIAAIKALHSEVNGKRKDREQLPILYEPSEFLILKPNAVWEDRKKVFEENTKKLRTAESVLAILDERDTGTVWEIGWIAGRNTLLRRQIPIIGVYLENEPKVNVMLQCGLTTMVLGVDELHDYWMDHFVRSERMIGVY